MDSQEILDIFRQYDALLEGHFILTSGLHSDRYIQCALVLQHPQAAEKLGAELATRLRAHGSATATVAPALGGILVAHEVARALRNRALFTERQDGAMTLRRGFQLAAGEPVVVVEDVITTGGSTLETIQAVERAGGRVIAAGSLIDRSGGTALPGIPREALVTLNVQNFKPADCPLCKAGIPAIKPGSRQQKAGV